MRVPSQMLARLHETLRRGEGRHMAGLSLTPSQPLSDSAQLRPPCLLPVFTRSPVRGISVALRHSVFCFASRPRGFRFLPKQIRSKTGTEREANFFRFPPKKQTFGTWEPGPLPWLCHV